MQFPGKHVRVSNAALLPRLPLEGTVEFTYRCTNQCRHCWIREQQPSQPELSTDEWKRVVREARLLGCRGWIISGGEPMLRPDFPELFDYITARSLAFSLNTNGTLVTPAIARLLKRNGVTMVSLYGADAAVHDHITATPGSFERTMRGMRYLKEAGVNFIVQLMAMRDNYHQVAAMVSLASSLGRRYKFGSSWLYLSACGDPRRNAEIIRQRLSPAEVVAVERPYIGPFEGFEPPVRCGRGKGRYLFSACVKGRRDFHVDPYGGMSFCCFIKDPALRYDLRQGSFRECWERFIPSLARKVKPTAEYRRRCAGCETARECAWCPAYGFLEQRRFSAPVEYLCRIAGARKAFVGEWLTRHRRRFAIGGLTVQVDSEIPFAANTYHPKFEKFKARAPGRELISITHRFSIPRFDMKELGAPVYRKTPWAVYKKRDSSWVYLGITSLRSGSRLHRAMIFSPDHTKGVVYHENGDAFRKGNMASLTLLPTDQIVLARILADRQGCMLHSCGVRLGGKGFVFAGFSGAGKSTVAGLLADKAEILCDDRMIIRRVSGGFRIFGTWSHGTRPEVSGNSAPLAAVIFLEKSACETRLIPMNDKREITRNLLTHVIQPLVTADWWEKTLRLVEGLSNNVPFYVLRFQRDSRPAELLKTI